MPARIGILAILHESNTFIAKPTTLADFQRDTWAIGEDVRTAFAGGQHEISGFFQGLADAGLDAVPIFAARALPHGAIDAKCSQRLVQTLLAEVDRNGPLDGYLIAPHGAAVSETWPDFDGHWMLELRRHVGPLPIIGTLDLHANLSPKMVEAADALIAYQTNPHLDQFARGLEAASLMARTIRGQIIPTMAAAFPPMIANIERQATAEPHWGKLLKMQTEFRQSPQILSTSLIYGFPYADVTEMGSSVIVVTDSNAKLAQETADNLARVWWQDRAAFAAQLISIDDALTLAQTLPAPVGLLDMGDNVGGGSSADSSDLVIAMQSRDLGPTIVVINDPDAVKLAEAAGVGATLELTIGKGVGDGDEFQANVRVVRLCDGKFEEHAATHGGIRHFDQGRTALVRTTTQIDVLLTTHRTAPLSVVQLTSCGIDPLDYRYIILKGVHAPVGAYHAVCKSFVRVNTTGVTTADLNALSYKHRRQMFPFEDNV